MGNKTLVERAKLPLLLTEPYSDDLLVSDATYYLKCRHCVGCRYKTYFMPCIPLKRMNDGRYKILVFGERFWNDRKHIKRVRYAAACRIYQSV